MLEISGLGKSFDGFAALSNVDLMLTKSERHAVIGPNGAGKTTFFNCITGHLAPSAGEVRFKSQLITGMPPHAIVKRGVARSFQRINIFPRLTVFENVQVALISDRGHTFDLIRSGAALYRDEVNVVLETVGLIEDGAETAGLLSYGRQKQLELAIALAAEPELLLLDEPTAGMSPQETADTIKLIAEIADGRGLTLLFTEHDMEVVFQIADRISVLHHGEIITTGAPDAVRSDPQVRMVYLGEDDDGAA